MADQRVRDLEREVIALAPDGLHTGRWKSVLQAAIASGRRDTPRTIELARAGVGTTAGRSRIPQCGLYLGYAYQDRGEGKLSQQSFA
jgi:hypothetical protein